MVDRDCGTGVLECVTTLWHTIIRLPVPVSPKRRRRRVIQAAARRAALVNAAAERLHRWRIVAGDVEAVGIVKNVWVAVGDGGVDNDLSQLTCRGATHCDAETLLHRGPR